MCSLKGRSQLLKVSPLTPMHTHMQAEPTQSLEGHVLFSKQECREREMWKRELRGNRRDGDCPRLATGINCTPVSCLQWCMLILVTVATCALNSLGGPLRALIWRGERGTDVVWKLCVPVIVWNMNFRFHLLWRSGSEEQWGGRLCVFRNGSTIPEQYRELGLQHPCLMRKTISPAEQWEAE